MLPGPVFTAELLTSARRGRYYLLRVIYGMILLGVLWMTYLESRVYRQATGGTASIEEIASFAQSIFWCFAVTQGLMVLAITPGMVAGAIVEEKRRKTLHYLMASPLSSAEIVLGKLMARSVHLVVFLAIGLPVISLLTLFGGIDPLWIGIAYLVTFSTAFFLAALAIYVSTIARLPREAISLVYILELGWLVVPPMVDVGVRFNWPNAYPWVAMVNDWVLYSSPSGILSKAPFLLGTPTYLLGWIVGMQLGYAAILVALAVWRLRPVYVAQESGSKFSAVRQRLLRWQWRLLPRPALRNDPMLWKEMWVARSSGLVRLAGAILGLIIGLFVMYGLIYFGEEAVRELMSYGYGTFGSYRAREEFNNYLRVICTFAYVILIVGIAATAATTVTHEREGDTWTSLTATPLEGKEIMGAKMIGAVWAMRWVAAFLFLLWLAGLAVGAVHPLGIVASSFFLALYAWFTVAFATWVSLKAKTSLRAQVTTIFTLLVVNGGYMTCCVFAQPDTPIIAAGCSPFVMVVALFNYGDFAFLLDPRGSGFHPVAHDDLLGVLAMCFVSLLIYGAAAFGFMSACFDGFNKAVDRPRRSESFSDSSADKPKATELEEV